MIVASGDLKFEVEEKRDDNVIPLNFCVELEKLFRRTVNWDAVYGGIYKGDLVKVLQIAEKPQNYVLKKLSLNDIAWDDEDSLIFGMHPKHWRDSQEYYSFRLVSKTSDGMKFVNRKFQ